MSNKLKTLSRTQLERLISNVVGDYVDGDVDCKVSRMSYEHFNDEDEIALKDDRSISFEVNLHYMDPIIDKGE